MSLSARILKTVGFEGRRGSPHCTFWIQRVPRSARRHLLGPALHPVIALLTNRQLKPLERRFRSSASLIPPTMSDEENGAGAYSPPHSLQVNWASRPELARRLTEFLGKDSQAQRWAYYLGSSAPSTSYGREKQVLSNLTAHIFKKDAEFKSLYRRDPKGFTKRVHNFLKSWSRAKANYDASAKSLGHAAAPDVKLEPGSPEARKLVIVTQRKNQPKAGSSRRREVERVSEDSLTSEWENEGESTKERLKRPDSAQHNRARKRSPSVEIIENPHAKKYVKLSTSKAKISSLPVNPLELFPLQDASLADYKEIQENHKNIQLNHIRILELEEKLNRDR
ncbi:hypothetical protein SISSUDRAFT_1034808 [Sistotremastrum suecicum HHB10207 ss-3]|uniref:Uncharacterized protein n=1 Tax=Sistotremastrum suecicum HHB10207 ss-3 TaxID=1314776 RepID=A0A166BK21_9AGAM|nr:hypothetical protein SISSUDRAFT_1034808 [Sistotremastrum suecicum HHB10207 ss-3]